MGLQRVVCAEAGLIVALQVHVPRVVAPKHQGRRVRRPRRERKASVNAACRCHDAACGDGEGWMADGAEARGGVWGKQRRDNGDRSTVPEEGLTAPNSLRTEGRVERFYHVPGILCVDTHGV